MPKYTETEHQLYLDYARARLAHAADAPTPVQAFNRRLVALGAVLALVRTCAVPLSEERELVDALKGLVGEPTLDTLYGRVLEDVLNVRTP